MKMASYFLISAAFHAAVLTFPIPGLETAREPVIPVVLLVETRKTPTQTPARNSGVQKDEKKARKKINKKPQIKKPVEEVVEPTKPDKEEEVKEAVSENDIFPPLIETVREEALVVAEVTRPDIKRVKVFSTAAVGESTKSREQPKEEVSLQTEIKFQQAVEEKKNSMPPAEVVFAQAGYAYNPKPQYPEEARREGWEGVVLLRVLVDSEGGPESIELSRSSGFETLDQAAVQSVKSWRFHPARYGDQRVESWVKIPIIFRLADLKN